MRMRKAWVLVACVLLVAPTYALAGPPQQAGASKHFPDDPNTSLNVASAATGDLELKLKLKMNCPKVETPKFPLNGPMAGADVATLSANELCSWAVDPNVGYVASGFCTPAGACGSPCAGSSCCVATTGQTQTVVFRWPGSGACYNRGFVLTRTMNSDTFDINPISEVGAAAVVSLLSISDVGNEIATDLLPNWIVQVDPKGVNGNVDFGVATIGNPSACNFSVNTAAYPDDPWGLHEKIAEEYRNCPLSPQLNCRALHPGQGGGKSGFPEKFFGGPFVFCRNVKGAKVTELTVDGLEDQVILRETVTGIGGEIPTLSTWGMALLVVTLLLLGTWMLRRRRLGQRA